MKQKLLSLARREPVPLGSAVAGFRECGLFELLAAWLGA